MNEDSSTVCRSRGKSKTLEAAWSRSGIKVPALLSLPTTQTVGVGLLTTAKHTRGVFTHNTLGSGWKWQVCGTLHSNILISCRRQRCPPPPPPATAATTDRRCSVLLPTAMVHVVWVKSLVFQRNLYFNKWRAGRVAGYVTKFVCSEVNLCAYLSGVRCAGFALAGNFYCCTG